MTPVLQAGEYVFCVATSPAIIEQASRIAMSCFRESEGVAFILDLENATALGFDTALPMRHIVLEVYSALDGVGLTAAVASALAAEGIACNMVAAYHHDHVFVPSSMAEHAVSILKAVQREADEAPIPE